MNLLTGLPTNSCFIDNDGTCLCERLDPETDWCDYATDPRGYCEHWYAGRCENQEAIEAAEAEDRRISEAYRRRGERINLAEEMNKIMRGLAA